MEVGAARQLAVPGHVGRDEPAELVRAGINGFQAKCREPLHCRRIAHDLRKMSIQRGRQLGQSERPARTRRAGARSGRLCSGGDQRCRTGDAHQPGRDHPPGESTAPGARPRAGAGPIRRRVKRTCARGVRCPLPISNCASAGVGLAPSRGKGIGWVDGDPLEGAGPSKGSTDSAAWSGRCPPLASSQVLNMARPTDFDPCLPAEFADTVLAEAAPLA